MFRVGRPHPGIQLASAGRIEWALEWTAPDATTSEVAFHAAASNADESPLGDLIYTYMERSRPQ
jgi:hypothetical protein